VSGEGGSGGDAPVVVATKRLDNGPPDLVEIVLDRPLPLGERTTFTFTDVDPANPGEPTIQTVAYTFQRGDVNADGQWNLRDFAALQQCHGMATSVAACVAFDYNGDAMIDLTDYDAFLEDFLNDEP
jgi:hypothetical protein